MNDSKSHIWIFFFVCFENIISRILLFYISQHVPFGIIRVCFYYFGFSIKKAKSQQKLAKKSAILQYSFTQKTSLILRTSSHLHCIIFRRPRIAFLKHFECKCLYISVYLRKNILVLET